MELSRRIQPSRGSVSERCASYRFAGSVIIVSILLGVNACTSTPDDGPPPPTEPTPPTTHTPVINKELMITDLTVVNDDRTKGPDGPWSLGGLVTHLAGSGDRKAFVLNWLNTWQNPQTVNGETVAPRPSIRNLVIDGWKQRDGQPGVSDASWNMDFANAPFRLLAIVNRVDLNRMEPGDTDKSAGEGRFVFGVLGPNDEPLPFTVIFEYRLIGTDRERLRGWAQEWHALGAINNFGPQFNAALQVITDKFSGPRGQLNQIRTNEIALNDPWELREFRLRGGALVQTPTLQTPANRLQGSAVLTKFINDNEAEIIEGTVQVPSQFENAPFMAGASQVPRGFSWQAPGVGNNEARHKLAAVTCNGCHHIETGTDKFLHVANRPPNQEAELSGFLKGIEVNDPADSSVRHKFNDLEDRAKLLLAFVTEPGAVRLNALTQPRRARVH